MNYMYFHFFNYFFIFIIFLNKFRIIYSHGRLADPPARSSAWREDPLKFPTFYDDNQMYCGGVHVQWQSNDGKCGICGENINGVKRFEKGGSHYTGIKVRSYTQGQVIDVNVKVSANHKGWFEFRLCKVDGLESDATQDCLDKLLLKDVYDKTRIELLPNVFDFHTKLQLPQDLTCQHCVFQWKYHAGNSWNKDPVTGQICPGCGMQEEFFGCSDVEILSKVITLTDQPILTQSTTTTTTTTTPLIQKPASSAESATKVYESITEIFSTKSTTQPQLSTLTTYFPPFSISWFTLHHLKNAKTTNDPKPLTPPVVHAFTLEKKLLTTIIPKTTKLTTKQTTTKTTTTTISTTISTTTKIKKTKPPTTITTTSIPKTTTSRSNRLLNIFITAQTEQPVQFTLPKTTNKKAEDSCPRGDGYYADLATECREYYVCVFSGTPLLKVVRKSCPDGLYFEPRLKICNLRDSVVCDIQ